MPGPRALCRQARWRGQRCRRWLGRQPPQVVAQLVYTLRQRGSAGGDLPAALGAGLLKRERVELLELRDVEHFLAQVAQECRHCGVDTRAVHTLGQHLSERALDDRYWRGWVVERPRHQVAQRRADARQVGEARLLGQRIGQLGVLDAVLAREALGGPFHGGGDPAPQPAFVELLIERLAEQLAEQLAEHLAQRVRQNIEHSDSPCAFRACQYCSITDKDMLPQLSG